HLVLPASQTGESTATAIDVGLGEIVKSFCPMTGLTLMSCDALCNCVGRGIGYGQFHSEGSRGRVCVVRIRCRAGATITKVPGVRVGRGATAHGGGEADGLTDGRRGGREGEVNGQGWNNRSDGYADSGRRCSCAQ